MTPRQSFNLLCALQLDRVKTFGYARAVEFRSLAGAPLPTQAASGDARTRGEERSGRPPKYHPQVHRANRNVERAAKYSIFGLDDDELSPEQLKKRRSNQAYHARKKAAKAHLRIVWPVTES